MIVRNESHVIQRCLESIKPWIDYWVISDTGSTDHTQEIIKDFLQDIPGELHQHPWINFGYNRNEVLKLAKRKGDYLLLIDADEVLEGVIDKNHLDKDLYLIKLRLSTQLAKSSRRAFLIKNSLDFYWEGVIHEEIKFVSQWSAGIFDSAFLRVEMQDGHRSQNPKKYLEEAKKLERVILDDPRNSAYIHHLAVFYELAGEFELALKYHQKRASMEGFDENTFWSKYSIGKLQEMLQMDPSLFIKSYQEAYRFRPSRAEPLYHIAQYYLKEQNYILGYLLAQYALSLPVPLEIYYVENWIYDWGLLATLADCSMKMGHIQEAKESYLKISKMEAIPEHIHKGSLLLLSELSNL